MNAKLLLLQAILPQILDQIVHLLPPDALEKMADTLLDAGVKAVKASQTQIDDITLLPVLEGLRQVQKIRHFEAGPPPAK